MTETYPVTPDGRYFVVRGRLWRRSNPALPPEQAQSLVKDLMDARRRLARSDLAVEDRAATRERVDVAKRSLGERGAVWWHDGAPDFNRHMVRNTPYAGWYESLAQAS
ncbi:hypothetical protein CDL60_14060 [Roseateles noduli]|nr:hypothetical protein CDL60_14060 [Roseateles noduli]